MPVLVSYCHVEGYAARQYRVDEVCQFLYLIVMWRCMQRGSTELMRCASSCI